VQVLRLPGKKALLDEGLQAILLAIEHVNRRCKIFRIVKETYRGKHKNVHKTWTVIAG